MDEGKYTLSKALQEGYEKGLEINKANKERKLKVAKRIQTERKKQGYTQETFSIKTGINRITYSGHEIGRTEPTTECLVRIADALNVTLDYLCCRTDEKNSCEESDLKPTIENLLKRIEALENKQ